MTAALPASPRRRIPVDPPPPRRPSPRRARPAPAVRPRAARSTWSRWARALACLACAAACTSLGRAWAAGGTWAGDPPPSAALLAQQGSPVSADIRGGPNQDAERDRAQDGAQPLLQSDSDEALGAGSGHTQWLALLARDARVGFASFSARSAREDLSRADLSPSQRAAAFMALACAGDTRARADIAAWQARGSAIERQGAVLALGELGGGSTKELEVLARGSDGPLAECAMLALARSRELAARALVESMATGEPTVLSVRAQRALDFLRDPQSVDPNQALRTLFELRFAAAQRHGLIDGKTWRVYLLESLGADEEFLSRFVYGAATRMRRPGVRDHFLQVVLEDGDAIGLSAAMDVIPTEIAQVVATGLWVPDGVQWTTLMSSIEDRHTEALTEPLLDHALVIERLGSWAALLLLRGGNMRGRAYLDQHLPQASAEERTRVVRGLGSSGNPLLLSWLSDFAEDPDAGVRAAVLVAQARLGHEGAERTLEILLANEELAQRQIPREYLVEALSQAEDDPVVLKLLDGALGRVTGPARLEVATALCRAGRAEGAGVVRESLRASPPTGHLGAVRVAALSLAPSDEDLKLLRDLFPLEGESEVNAELALGLYRARDAVVLPLLRAALWRGPFHRSVLAGGLLADLSTLDALRQELENHPRTARLEDLRRVGFAIGEWGGMGQVDLLARRSNASDPGLVGAVLGALSARTQ